MIGPATGVAKKQNVPPFRGGTCASFYAHRQVCQRIAGTGPRWQSRSRRLNNGKCGRATRTLARESLRIVAFRLSGTTSRAGGLILSVLVLGVNARARFPCPARAKGFCLQGILGNGTRKRALRQSAGATQREECDDGNDLDRRSRRATEEAVGSRPFRQSDCRGARKCDPQCSDRQG